MFNTILALGTIALQIGIVIAIVAWCLKAPLLQWIAKHSTLLLRTLFVISVTGSLIYQYGFGYEPCILCWYQRIAIFPITFLAFTSNLQKSSLLRRQILFFALFGIVFALLHNYLDIFPASGIEVCGASSISCLVRYVYEFGYITIPMMSITVLTSALLLTLIARRYPQDVVVAPIK